MISTGSIPRYLRRQNVGHFGFNFQIKEKNKYKGIRNLQLHIQVDVPNLICMTMNSFHCSVSFPSGVAQWKRVGLITQRSIDRNHPPLLFFPSFFWRTSQLEVIE